MKHSVERKLEKRRKEWKSQEKTYHSHYKAVELSDFPKQEGIARAYDMEYFECSDNDSLSDELDRFLACPKASLMVCYVDSKNNTK